MSTAITELVGKEHSTLFKQLTEAFFDYVKGSSASHIVVALPGGRSIVGLTEMMAASAALLPTEDWNRLQFFMVDERCVPLDSPDSNFGLLKKHFYSPLLERGVLNETQIHPFKTSEGKEEKDAESYRALLKTFGGEIHATFLGAGEDGHIAALFPNHPTLQSQQSTFLILRDSPKPPPVRMTASLPLLTSAKFGAVLFLGEGKRAAFEKFKEGKDANGCPSIHAKRIGKFFVVTDL